MNRSHKFIILAVVLVILSAALPAYSQALFISLSVPEGLAPTLANIVNILMQVIISYPTMKFWVMPDKKIGAQGSSQRAGSSVNGPHSQTLCGPFH